VHFTEKGHPTALPGTASDNDRIALEYITTVLKEDSVYMMPRRMELGPEAIAMVPFNPDAPEAVLDVVPVPDHEEDDRFFFRVLNKHPLRARVVPTDMLEDPTVAKVQVQRLCERVVPAAPDKFELFIHDAPEQVDLLSFAPWDTWRNRAMELKCTGQNDVPGTLQYTHHKALAIEDGMKPEDLPAIVAIEELVANGWMPDRVADADHLAIDDRTFSCKPGFSRSPLYFACLTVLEALFEAGLTSLALGQHNQYYRAALLSTEKDKVVKNLKVAQYQKMLKDGVVDEALPLPAPPAPVIHDPLPLPPPGFEDLPPVIVDIGPAGLPPGSDSDGGGGEFSDVEPPVGDGDGPVALGVVAFPIPAEHLTRGIVPVGLAQEYVDMCAEWIARGLPLTYRDHALVFEARVGGVSAPRWAIRCANPAHAGCNKTRSVRLCRNYGQAEVFGFLGLWVDRGMPGEPLSESTRVHSARFAPRTEDIHAWLAAGGYI